MDEEHRTHYEEEVEEVEIEVTDDEGSVVDEDTETTAKETPPSTSGTQKVVVSKEVAEMKHSSPEAQSKKASNSLSPNKNPFSGFGAWTEETLRQITIEAPILSGTDETTNALTRSNNPENRYWKAPIVYRYGPFSSTEIKFENVHVPYHTKEGYGNDFVYMCFPGFAADVFSEACKQRRPTRVTEAALVPDRNRWWKIANKVEGKFGYLNKTTGGFKPVSLETIFDSTHAGITVNAVITINFKASTMAKNPLKATTMGTLSVEVVRAYIEKLDVNVQMPARIPKNKNTRPPVATNADVASDDLMRRLAEIGI